MSQNGVGSCEIPLFYFKLKREEGMCSPDPYFASGEVRTVFFVNLL